MKCFIFDSEEWPYAIIKIKCVKCTQITNSEVPIRTHFAKCQSHLDQLFLKQYPFTVDKRVTVSGF